MPPEKLSGGMLERLRQRRATNPSAAPYEAFRNIALGIAGVVSSVVIPIVGAWVSYEQGRQADYQRDKALSETFTELGVKILSDNPTPERAPLRKWAIGLINNYSDIKLPADAEDILLNDVTLVAATGSDADFRTTPIDVFTTITNGKILGLTLLRINTKVDLQALKARGIRFVFVQAPSSLHPDGSGTREVLARARDAGLVTGIYFWFNSRQDPIAQANMLISFLKSEPWSLPPYIDCEPLGDEPIGSDYADKLLTFLAKLEKGISVHPSIYTSRYFADRHLDARFGGYPLHVESLVLRQSATKPRLPHVWSDYQFWQVSASVDDPVLKERMVSIFNGTDQQFAAIQVHHN